MTTKESIAQLNAREKRQLATRLLLASGATDGLPLRLRAFVRARDGRAPEPGDLRGLLRERLPEHMLPAGIEAVSRWPTLPNGKVDRKALLTMPPPAAPAPAAPEASEARFESEAERALCDVAGAVLGREPGQLHGRFYELGGDSINAIQVISRLRSRGWELSVRELLSTPSVRACARQLRPWKDERPDHRERSGRIGALPIHRWLLRQGPAAAHYNQSQMLDFRGRADPATLSAALAHLVRHHPVLRAVVRDGELWQDEGQTPWDGYRWVDWTDATAVRERVQDEVRRLETGFDLERGPLFKAVLFRLPTGDQLFLLAHHLVIDGVSWRILLEDLGSTYGLVQSGRGAAVAPPRGSLAAWIEGLEAMVRAGRFDGELEHWKSMRFGPVLPGGDPQASGRLGDAFSLTLELEPSTSEALLNAGLKAYQMKPDDALLGALSLALRDWLGGASFVVEVEGHGREELAGLAVDVSRVVGWFTSLHPVRLEVRAEPLGDHVLRTKETLRSTPSRGLGYGALREMRGLKPEEVQSLKTDGGIVFNYLGSFDRELSQTHWQGLPGHRGWSAGSDLPCAHAVSINAVQVQGRFRMTIAVDRRRCSAEQAERFAGLYRRRMEELAQHCREQEGRRRFSPSDFDLAGIVNQTELDAADRELMEKTGSGLCDVERLRELTPVQEGMRFISFRGQAGDAYVAHQHLRLKGQVNVEALHGAYVALLSRHEILRVRQVGTASGQPLQAFMREATPEWRFSDLRGKDAGERLHRLILADRNRGFDLARDTLFRATLSRVDEDAWSLLITFHHIILDGWSVPVLIGELFAFYASFVDGRQARLPAPVPFTRHLDWLRRVDQKAVHAYWARRLQGVDGTGVLPLQLRAQAPSRRTERYGFGPALSEQTRNRARLLGTSVNALTLTAWTLVLRLWATGREVVVGHVTSGRAAEVEHVERMIGMCVSTLPFRLSFDGAETLGALVQRVQALVDEDQAHASVALARLQAELGRTAGLFDHLYVFRNESLPVAGRIGGTRDGLAVEEVTGDDPTEYALDVGFSESGGELALTLRWNTSAFEDPELPTRFPRYVQRVLAALAGQPQLPLAGLTLLGEEERQQVLVEFNATTTAYPRDAAVPELFETIVDEHSTRVALVMGAEQLTYADLDRRANAVGRLLRDQYAVGPGVMVGLHVERSLELVVGILGILKAGGTYVPLDPSSPPDHLGRMLADCAAPVVLVKDALPPGINYTGAVVTLNRPTHDAIETGRPGRPGDDRHPAYVMYTSGSTGRPNGVRIPHRGIVRLVRGQNYASFVPGEVFLALASPAFDASTFEIWGPLLNGATCVIYPERWPEFERLETTIREHGVTCLWLTAGLFNQIIEQRPGLLATVRHVLTGGEALSVPHVQQALKRWPGLRLTNGYGPTESTTFACAYSIPPNGDWPGRSVPIGRPIANTRAYVLDGFQQPVPVGVPGELYLGGDGLALGYLNRPELDAARFVTDPFSTDVPARLYRTGDRCRWLADGTIEFLGRLDAQVKLRGFRIEPGEIEAALESHPAVGGAVVVVREDSPGDRRLVAYFESRNGTTAPPGEIRRHLGMRLPDYMVPAAFVPVERLPLTANGKVDRRALPEPGRVALSAPEAPAPRHTIEIELVAIWKRLLGLEHVGINENFFELGGHSLLALRLVLEIERRFDRKLSLPAVLAAPTIEQISQRLIVAARSREEVPRLRGHGSGAPLFHVPGVDGVGLLPSALVRLLEGERPFFDALQYPGMDGTGAPCDRIEDIAAAMLEQIRRVRPHGPYCLTGFCFGGLVAYEVARRLELAGEKVEALILWDAHPARWLRRRPWREVIPLLWRRMRKSNARTWLRSLARRVFASASFRATNFIARFGRRVSPPLSSPAANVDLTPDEVFRRVRAAGGRALGTYRPGSYHGRVDLFETRSLPDVRIWWRPIPQNGWQGIICGPLHRHFFDCGHNDLLQEPVVTEVARQTFECLRATETASQSPALALAPERSLVG